MNANPLGQYLLERGLLSHDQLRVALIEQQVNGLQLGDVLLALGFVDAHCLREVLAERLGHPSINLDVVVPDPLALALLDVASARALNVLPVSWIPEQRKLVLATLAPDDIKLLDRVRALLPAGTLLEAALTSEADLHRALDRHYGSQLSIDSLISQLEVPIAEGPGFSAVKAADVGASVIRLVDAILSDAAAKGASDIHLEPGPAYVRIRYRVDGVLREIRCLHRSCWSSILVRLKVMAGLDIAETRAPQDGRFSMNLAGRHLDLRLATHPVLDGENMVVRILDRQRGLLGLNRLEISLRSIGALRQIMQRPDGLILVTGPTGSGKTTTLYAMLDHINGSGVNIMTLEDPVEYALPLIRQTSLPENSKIDFAGGVRSLLRQDPDVLLIGEIRDAGTAEMAMHAALTGHRVLSTLHCSSAITVFPRLMELGIHYRTLAAGVTGIVAQRLVRRLCLGCRERHASSCSERAALCLQPDATAFIYRPSGCTRCGGTGYSGRVPVMEILQIDDEIQALLLDGNIQALLQVAGQRGFCTIADEARERVLDGTTSVDEMLRVVGNARRVCA